MAAVLQAAPSPLAATQLAQTTPPRPREEWDPTTHQYRRQSIAVVVLQRRAAASRPCGGTTRPRPQALLLPPLVVTTAVLDSVGDRAAVAQNRPLPSPEAQGGSGSRRHSLPPPVASHHAEPPQPTTTQARHQPLETSSAWQTPYQQTRWPSCRPSLTRDRRRGPRQASGRPATGPVAPRWTRAQPYPQRRVRW